MSVKDDIYSGIRKAIVTENLSPGERLVESQLCQQFGASRGPVREVLTQLNREGFVSLIPNKGAVVTKLSLQDLKDYYALIALLESKAAEWAVPNFIPADIEILKEIVEQLKMADPGDKEESVAKWGHHNLRFHRHFWEKSGNIRLVEQIEEIRQRILRYRYLSLMVPSFNDYHKDHRKIITTAKNGDAKKTGKIMYSHIIRARDLLLQHLTQIQGK
jgi:DNA-binding GntR family transcriptional regulator